MISFGKFDLPVAVLDFPFLDFCGTLWVIYLYIYIFHYLVIQFEEEIENLSVVYEGFPSIQYIKEMGFSRINSNGIGTLFLYTVHICIKGSN